MLEFDPAVEKIASAVGRITALRKAGRDEEAKSALATLLEEFPSHPNALEAQADDLAAQGQFKEAIGLYKKIIDENPGRVGTEKKHADLVFRTTAVDIEAQRLLTEGALLSGGDAEANKRRFGAAMVLSMLLPGTGQLAKGEFAKGFAFLLLEAVLLALTFAFGMDRRAKLPELTTAGWATIGGMFLLHVVAMLDAATAQVASAVPLSKVRPKPPVDKPFE